MRGPPSDYAPPRIYVYPDRSGPRPGVHFSRVELYQLGIAILLLSAALTLTNVLGARGLPPNEFALLIGIAFAASLVAVATGVGLHEIAHKIVAQRYGHWAEFRYNLRGLLMAFVFAFFGFLIAAPGATIVSGYVTKEQNGKISAAGPVSNLIIGALFLVASTAVGRTVGLSNFLGAILTILLANAFYLNVILAGFNMIPIMPFDGSKVFAWSKAAYLGIVILVIALFVTSLYVRGPPGL